MARFRVKAAHRATGVEQELVVEARDSTHAAAIAADRGLLVSGEPVEEQDEPLQPRTERGGRKRSGGWVLLIPALVCWTIGIIWWLDHGTQLDAAGETADDIEDLSAMVGNGLWMLNGTIFFVGSVIVRRL